MNLDELAIKYGSDKSSLGHGYMNFYSNTLPDNISSIMEIGVLKGASINVWKEAYPEANIWGVDLFEENPIPEIDGVNFLKGNQLDHELLYHIRNDIKPQIIIEDCSHNCIDHWVTMFSLISCCELYIIEDLHTCTEVFYRQGLPFESTILGAIKNNTFPFKFALSFNEKIVSIWK